MRANDAGVKMADAIIEFVHLMYQKETAKRVLSALISRLQNRLCEFDIIKAGGGTKRSRLTEGPA